MIEKAAIVAGLGRDWLLRFDGGVPVTRLIDLGLLGAGMVDTWRFIMG